MSQVQSLNKYNYISKIKIVNNNSNKIHNLVTARINNPNLKSKEKEKRKIFIKSLISRKDINNNKSTNIKTHKKFLSNIEDYNNLVKLNISNKLKKISGNKNMENPIHRRINTEKINCSINNIKKRNRNHFVLINTRNAKDNKELRFITEYFHTENSKDQKSIYNNNNSNSLSIDFHESITERTSKSKLNNFQKGSSEIVNTEIPNKKRYIKYLKANNLYNLSSDNTFSNYLFQKEDNNINNNMNITNYLNNIDTKKIRRYFRNITLLNKEKFYEINFSTTFKENIVIY